ncbi:FxDxF family PEP-CTERM protein [Rugamonas apoptosis]|uniref:PEP-CTERM sorting domain-containing protein n=1 Tax=Rugamonas apoptosis TaxID=2758570 RepID=A0A7W2FA21_9BURK|nr:FxDxF family PEP-CTERM protein [Rugamonas apoptosis]MBA5687837.1 PEP-CTERM sorting domain-containing protein [Rugamonas apoptosis]
MKLRNILAASALFAATVPAFAAVTVFDFSNLEYVGGHNTGLLPSEALNSGYWGCTGGDICSSNIDGHGHNLGGNLVYTVGGVSATATAQYQTGNHWHDATVVQDHENGYSAAHKIGAGLGVYHVVGDNSDDNITSHEKLTLTFAGPVTLSSVMLRSDGHDTSWDRNATFLLNGTSYKLADTISPAALTGSVFTFQFGGAKPDQFYLGGVTVSAVPEPSSYAMLLAGVGLLGFMARRRKPQA